MQQTTLRNQETQMLHLTAQEMRDISADDLARDADLRRQIIASDDTTVDMEWLKALAKMVEVNEEVQAALAVMNNEPQQKFADDMRTLSDGIRLAAKTAATIREAIPELPARTAEIVGRAVHGLNVNEDLTDLLANNGFFVRVDQLHKTAHATLDTGMHTLELFYSVTGSDVVVWIDHHISLTA